MKGTEWSSLIVNDVVFGMESLIHFFSFISRFLYFCRISKGFDKLMNRCSSLLRPIWIMDMNWILLFYLNILTFAIELLRVYKDFASYFLFAESFIYLFYQSLDLVEIHSVTMKLLLQHVRFGGGRTHTGKCVFYGSVEKCVSFPLFDIYLILHQIT